jgi:hypothetical protein
VLTDPCAQQDVSFDDGVITVERRLDEQTALLRFNFTPGQIAVGTSGDIVVDTSDDAWGGPGRQADVVGPWSARLAITPQR